MTKHHRTNTGPGWVKQDINWLKKQVRELAAGKGLQGATIGKGGITVKDEGRIRVLYPSGRDAINLGALVVEGTSETGFGFRFLADEDEGDTDVSIAELYVLPANPPLLPTPFKVVRFGNVENITLVALQSAALWAGDVASGDFGSVQVYDPSTNPSGVYIQATAGSDIVLDAGSAGVKIVHNTSGASANCVIDSTSGKISRSTSSRRYKQDIVDGDVDTAKVLALTPRRYRMKADVEEQGDGARTYVGFIAEEAVDAGLDDWVTYMDGVPDAFDYDRYVVALQSVVRQQADQIADLTTRLTALEEAAGGTQ